VSLTELTYAQSQGADLSPIEEMPLKGRATVPRVSSTEPPRVFLGRRLSLVAVTKQPVVE
jgi:hypothetical protein